MSSSSFSPVASSPSVPPWGTQSGGGGGGGNAHIVVIAFEEGDLVAGTFNAVHNFGQPYVLSRVYTNTGEEVTPDDNTIVDADTLAIALASFEPIAGTWRAVIVG